MVALWYFRVRCSAEELLIASRFPLVFHAARARRVTCAGNRSIQQGYLFTRPVTPGTEQGSHAGSSSPARVQVRCDVLHTAAPAGCDAKRVPVSARDDAVHNLGRSGGAAVANGRPACVAQVRVSRAA